MDILLLQIENVSIKSELQDLQDVDNEKNSLLFNIELFCLVYYK